MTTVSADTKVTWLWFAIATMVGLAIATQPLYVSILIIGLSFLVIVSAFTPLTLLAFLLVLAPLRTLMATESSFNLPADLGQILFIVFLVGWGARKIIDRKPILDFRPSPIWLPLIIFILVSGATVFTAFSLHVWVSEWLKWVIIFVIVLLISQIKQTNTPDLLAFMLIVSAVGNALVGLYIFFGGSGADHLLINGRFFRAFGTFGQPNPFGGFLGLVLPLSIMSVWGHSRRLVDEFFHNRKIVLSNLVPLFFYTTTTSILLSGLVASWSRGAWLAFIAATAAMAFALPQKLWQSILLSGLVGLTVVAMWFAGLIPDAIKQRVASSTQELITIQDVRGVDITSANYAINERLAHWQAAMNMAWDYPWLGVGLGNYEVAYEQYRLLNWDEPLGHAHNYYLNILAEAGMIGLLAYLGLWGSILWLTWTARHHPDILTRSLIVGLFGTWTYLAIHSLLDNLFVNNLFIHLGVMIGLLNIVYQQTKLSYSIEVS